MRVAYCFWMLQVEEVRHFYKLILAKLQSEGKIALASKSIGIAATLLTGDHTLHNTYKISLDLHAMDIPKCRIKKGTVLCKKVRQL